MTTRTFPSPCGARSSAAAGSGALPFRAFCLSRPTSWRPSWCGPCSTTSRRVRCRCNLAVRRPA
eukprot:53755-Eustigmatos_ZCMA.PRE.1